jgi:hypothetical protein
MSAGSRSGTSEMTPYDQVFLRLLELAPFDRRSRSGWRFGTKTISDPIVERLIASGHARRDGDRIVKTEPKPSAPSSINR